MAESLSEEDMPRIKVKCRQCRHTLLEHPKNRIVNLPVQPLNLAVQPRPGAPRATLALADDSLPHWVDHAIHESGWTKGRLFCSRCQARVGGFDFVGGSSSPVYIVRSKVDELPLGPLVSLIKPEPKSEIVLDQDDSAIVRDMEDVDNGEELSLKNVDKEAVELSETEITQPMSVISTSSEEDFSDLASSPESSTDTEEVRTVSKRQREKQRLRRRRKERLRRETERLRERKLRRERERKESRLKELLEAEPELQDLSDDLVCPVCLDLLHEPFQVEPCGHIFCEPCLRRLGQKNPMNCPCPLCRTRIGFCKHLAATAREIREQHEGLYLKRKKFEHSTPVFRYPLPWRPGWRNLIRGRPLGGNRFLPRDNRVEYIRAILHQVPYYIPSIFIVNFINIGIFAFMMGFIEVLPSLLHLFFGSARNGSVINNGSLDVAETSGDILPTDGADTERSLSEEIHDELVTADVIGSPALDTTFYYVLFALSVVVAAAGQFLLNQEVNQRHIHRVSDIILVVVVTCLPILLLPTLLPFRNSEGFWMGGLLDRMFRMVFAHINYHTLLLVVLAVGFIYHIDGGEEH